MKKKKNIWKWMGHVLNQIWNRDHMILSIIYILLYMTIVLLITNPYVVILWITVGWLTTVLIYLIHYRWLTIGIEGWMIYMWNKRLCLLSGLHEGKKRAVLIGVGILLLNLIAAVVLTKLNLFFISYLVT